jgi:hypothetical protein
MQTPQIKLLGIFACRRGGERLRTLWHKHSSNGSYLTRATAQSTSCPASDQPLQYRLTVSSAAVLRAPRHCHDLLTTQTMRTHDSTASAGALGLLDHCTVTWYGRATPRRATCNVQRRLLLSEGLPCTNRLHRQRVLFHVATSARKHSAALELLAQFDPRPGPGPGPCLLCGSWSVPTLSPGKRRDHAKFLQGQYSGYTVSATDRTFKTYSEEKWGQE